MYGLFTTITNANFDSDVFNSAVTGALVMRDELLGAARVGRVGREADSRSRSLVAGIGR